MATDSTPLVPPQPVPLMPPSIPLPLPSLSYNPMDAFPAQYEAPLDFCLDPALASHSTEFREGQENMCACQVEVSDADLGETQPQYPGGSAILTMPDEHSRTDLSVLFSELNKGVARPRNFPWLPRDERTGGKREYPSDPLNDASAAKKSRPLAHHRQPKHMKDEGTNRAELLSRNRAAAARCRSKKRHREEQLADAQQELEARNLEMVLYVKALREEVLCLKGEVLQHAKCNCESINRYIVNLARLSFSRRTPDPGTSSEVASSPSAAEGS